MGNTFNHNHLVTISNAVATINPAFKVKRSKAFTKAVVIGRPGRKGSVILSLSDEIVHDRAVWLMHVFKDLDPKTLADGDVNFSMGEETRDFYWSNMLKSVKAAVTELSQ